MYKQVVLGRLPAYNAVARPVVQDQDVYDIMEYIYKADGMFQDDYDQIYDLFVGATPLQTLRNLFTFLRPPNTKYIVESRKDQTVKSPAAILAECTSIGIDCKNYSLFIGGVLGAINRSRVQRIPFLYRFASYNPAITDPYHVFVVADIDGEEIWVDPVLKTFNERLVPFHYIDQKPHKKMLSVVSGPYQYSGRVGIDPATAAAIAQAAPKVIELIKGLFGGGRPNPNDWKGWDALDAKWGFKPGTQAAVWAVRVGDSAPNEVSNVLSYIQNVRNGDMSFLADTSEPPVQPDAFKAKLLKGGVAPEQAQQLYYALDAVYHPEKYTSTTSPGGGTNVTPNNGSSGSKSNTVWIVLGALAVGGGIYLATRK